MTHVASPTSKGSFHRAIVQTGAFALTQTALATAKSAGENFATRAGCATQTAECLRNLPVQTILDNQDNGATGYVPGVVDGSVLTPKHTAVSGPLADLTCATADILERK